MGNVYSGCENSIKEKPEDYFVTGIIFGIGATMTP